VKQSGFRGAVPLALLASFAAGVLVDGWFRTNGPPKPALSETSDTFLAAPSRSSVPAAPISPPMPPASASPAASPAATAGASNARLRVPIDGEDIETLKGGFAERRGGDRPHEAVDMLAPRNTPVHAVENGSIAKLFTSKAGGLTIYQFDPSGRLCYYYAHLDRYADGLKDGQPVTQGQIIGYVGTTGNAPPNTPHLHFAVFELNADKHWWQGRPVDPYRVFKDRG
jgi:murein DD-endopeptidase MepM/ murein hydrolase activator NlpD